MKYSTENNKIVEDWRKSGLILAHYTRLHDYLPNTFDG